MDIQNLVSEIKNAKHSIWKKNDEITKIEELIKQKEKILWNTCVHTWKRDIHAAFDDHIKYYCKTCGLWKSPSMYQ